MSKISLTEQYRRRLITVMYEEVCGLYSAEKISALIPLNVLYAKTVDELEALRSSLKQCWWVTDDEWIVDRAACDGLVRLYVK